MEIRVSSLEEMCDLMCNNKLPGRKSHARKGNSDIERPNKNVRESNKALLQEEQSSRNEKM